MRNRWVVVLNGVREGAHKCEGEAWVCGIQGRAA